MQWLIEIFGEDFLESIWPKKNKVKFPFVYFFISLIPFCAGIPQAVMDQNGKFFVGIILEIISFIISPVSCFAPYLIVKLVFAWDAYMMGKRFSRKGGKLEPWEWFWN